MRRDQHPPLFRNRRQAVTQPFVERLEASDEVGRARLKEVAATRVELREGLNDRGHAPAPEPRVEPNMRIVEVVGHGQELVAGQRVGHGRHRHPPCQSGEQLGQLPLEMQARGDDELCPGEPISIARRGPVGMRVDAGRHQAVDRHTVAADLSHEIRHDRGRGHHGRGRWLRPRGRKHHRDGSSRSENKNRGF